jgi:putative FmdB family regulatory protein
MPTYAYRCRRCGREFEKLQKITDPPRARCPFCKGSAERRITGGGGFLLKGGGFHATDYRSESYRQAAKQESGEGAAEPAGSGAEKDRKPGASPDKAGKGAPEAKPRKRKPAE